MAVEDSWQSLATVIPSSSPAPGHPDGRRELGEEGVGSEERSHPGSGTDRWKQPWPEGEKQHYVSKGLGTWKVPSPL